jgi:hypothetical protein
MPNVTTRRHVRCVGDLPRLLLAVTARTALWSVLLLALWASVPVAFGWHVTTVVSDSMAPGIRTGDVVAAMPVGPGVVEAGRVLLVADPDHRDRLRLHRLERIEQDGALRLRGDANPTADRTAVEPAAVLGVGVLRFPWIGLPGVWIRGGDWTSVLLAGVVTAVLVVAGRADRDIVAGRPCHTCGTPRRGLHSPVVAQPRTATTTDPTSTTMPVAVLTAAAITLTLLAGADAGAGFSGSTGTASALRTGGFGCFHQPAPGASLAWDFAEKDGSTVLDTSGLGRDGALGTGVSRADGSCDQNPFISFGAGSGADGVVHTKLAGAGPQVFALELWFRTDTQGRIIGFTQNPTGNTSAYDRNFYVGPDGHLVFGVWDGTVAKVVQSTARVDDSSWHHAVGQFTTGQLEMWLDGVRVAARADVTSAASYNGYWRAGHGTIDTTWPNSPTVAAFAGSIDTVRVHPTVLTPAVVREHHARGR